MALKKVDAQQPSESGMDEQPQSLLDKIRGAAIKTLFVVGTAALVLDSIRNSLTWYLGKLWGDAGIAWQQMWTGILARVSKHMSLQLFSHILYLIDLKFISINIAHF